MQGVTRFARSLLGVGAFLALGAGVFVLGVLTLAVLFLFRLSETEGILHKAVMFPLLGTLDLGDFILDKLYGSGET